MTIIYFEGSQVEKFPNNHVLRSLKIVFILANSEGPDKRPRFRHFFLGLYCLLKYPFSDFQYTNV